MPSTGTPSWRSSTGTTGASGAYTDAGPPDRMIPPRFMRRAVSIAFAGGAISHQVLASRTRRAISCAYCAPRSTTSTPRGSDEFIVSIAVVVVRRLLGDRDVVRMALLHPGRCDADEARALPQLADRRRAAVAHARAHATGELVHVRRELALVRHHAFDALGHELVGLLHVALAVTLLRALLHRADRAHAAHGFERAALVEDHFTR